MIVNGRQFSLTTLLPEERLRGVGVLLYRNHEASFFVEDKYKVEQCIAEMIYVNVKSITEDGIYLTGMDKVQSETKAEDTYSRWQEWSLKYVESK